MWHCHVRIGLSFRNHDLVLDALVVEVCEVGSLSCVEEDVCCAAYDLVIVCAWTDLMVIELEPLFPVQCDSCVVSGLQGPVVV